MAGREDYGNFMAASPNISWACNYFKSLWRRACKHVEWPYTILLPIASRDEGNIWVALSSTCPECHRGFVSMPKGSFMLWRGYIPIRCDHGGEIGELTAAVNGLPEGSREVQMPVTVEPLAPVKDQ